MLFGQSYKIINTKPKGLQFRFHLYRLLISALIIISILLVSFSTPAIATTGTQSGQGQDTGHSTTLLDPNAGKSLSVDANTYVLYDVQSGMFLLGKDPDKALAPASMTKAMTLLLAFEKLKLTDTITVTREMYDTIPPSYVRLGLVEGEQITVEEAIYASLLISANDASMALALTMGGTVENFAQMMNGRAKELGCTQTFFTNPYGLADEKHVTSAHDMALIMAAALEIDNYRKIATTSDYTLPATNKYSKTRSLTNANRFVSSPACAYENYQGGKTGYTELSGYTIAAGAKKDDRLLVGVVFGASNSEVRYTDLIQIFNYGFDHYAVAKLDPSEFDELVNHTTDRISESIKTAGYNLAISDVDLQINDYCTVDTNYISCQYTTTSSFDNAVIEANQARQVLDFPLYRQYADGVKYFVGTLSVTISDPATAALGDDWNGSNRPSVWAIIVQVGLILILLAILAFCLIIFFMMQKEKKRRQSRKNPNVL